MPPGSSITVPGTWGPVSVTAISWKARRYRWENKTIAFELDPRLHRWYGSLGLFGMPDGSDRLIAIVDGQPVVGAVSSSGLLASISIAEEHQLYWHSQQQLEASLRHANDGYAEARTDLAGGCARKPVDAAVCEESARSVVGPKYWTDDGLEVTLEIRKFTYGGTPVEVLDAYIIQNCIRNQKPSHLRGATATLMLRGSTGKKIATYPCRSVGEDAYIDTWEKFHPDQS